MSHAQNIRTQFKIKETLFKQFENLGWTIKQNEKINTYATDPRKSEVHQYVAKNVDPNGYDVGINFDEEGNAVFVADYWGGSIERSLGKNMTKVKQGYALAELAKAFASEDLAYTVEEVNGSLLVTAS